MQRSSRKTVGFDNRFDFSLGEREARTFYAALSFMKERVSETEVEHRVFNNPCPISADSLIPLSEEQIENWMTYLDQVFDLLGT